MECHAPYESPAGEVRAALDDVGLEMVSLNTRSGDQPGDLGAAALPGRVDLARSYIDEAIEYADDVGCVAVSVLAGNSGRTEEAEATYRSNLAYASETAAGCDITVLLEPMNTTMTPEYHLVSADRGAETIVAVGRPNLKLMIDFFHLSIMEPEPMSVIKRVMPLIGHVQFASIPHRHEPDQGDVDYSEVLPWLAERGYRGHFGAEYTPAGAVEDGLGWMETIQKGKQ